MIRALGVPLALFALPFVLYAAWHALRLSNPLADDVWTRRVVVPLAVVGLLIAVGGLVVAGLTAPRYEGGYVPAHIENGHIVPGQMR